MILNLAENHYKYQISNVLFEFSLNSSRLVIFADFTVYKKECLQDFLQSTGSTVYNKECLQEKMSTE